MTAVENRDQTVTNDDLMVVDRPDDYYVAADSLSYLRRKRNRLDLRQQEMIFALLGELARITDPTMWRDAVDSAYEQMGEEEPWPPTGTPC